MGTYSKTGMASASINASDIGSVVPHLSAPLGDSFSRADAMKEGAFNSTMALEGTLPDHYDLLRPDAGISIIDLSNRDFDFLILESLDKNIDTKKLTSAVDKFKADAARKQLRKQKITKGFGIAGQAADILSSILPNRPEYQGDYGHTTLALDSAYDATANGLMASGTPWGAVAGGAMKVGAVLNKAVGLIGGGTDGMSSTDAVLGSSFLGLTPIGLINGFGGKRADTFNKDTETFNMSMGSYGGSEALADSAAHKSGKKYGLFSSGARKRANEEMARARVLQNKISGIVHEALDLRDIAANMSQLNTNNYNYTIGGLYDNPYSLRAAKSGMKLKLARDWLKPEKVIIKLPETPVHKDGGVIELIQPTYIDVVEIDIPMFLKGGSINVIPDGALHAHKHHMEDADNLTKKGIPVVDNDGEQQCEIERGEIIFRYEITQKLEELLKIFYSDESSNKEKEDAALEAGKILTYEILHNTKDETNQLL